MAINGKLKRFLSNPYTVATAFFLFFIGLYLHLYYREAGYKIETANQSYYAGEIAVTVAERKTDFNKALDIYLAMEEAYDPRFGNGMLYYNIGNTYFQLGEYPMAVLYYYRALYLSPYDSRTKNNLKAALRKLDLHSSKKGFAFADLFFFHTLLPLPRRLQVFFFLALATFLLASYYLWKPSERIKLAGIITGALTVLMLLSFGYTYFLENPNAVIIKGTYLYRGAGKNFATVGEGPIKPGSKVEVYQSDLEGTWLKVATPQGNIGFVPHESLRLVF